MTRCMIFALMFFSVSAYALPTRVDLARLDPSVGPPRAALEHSIMKRQSSPRYYNDLDVSARTMISANNRASIDRLIRSHLAPQPNQGARNTLASLIRNGASNRGGDYWGHVPSKGPHGPKNTSRVPEPATGALLMLGLALMLLGRRVRR